MDEIQAAFLTIKLPDLDQDNTIRRQIARQYISEIKNEKIVLPFYDYSENHVFHLFVIRTKDRTALQNYLLRNNIQTLIHYPIPPHKQKALSFLKDLSFPITEKIHEEVLSLSISPVMENAEVDFVIKILNGY